jgi:hypothetical protein
MLIHFLNFVHNSDKVMVFRHYFLFCRVFEVNQCVLHQTEYNMKLLLKNCQVYDCEFDGCDLIVRFLSVVVTVI